jgi:predicted GNAT superfamily acetyltransferase
VTDQRGARPTSPAPDVQISSPTETSELAVLLDLYQRVFRYSEAGLNVRLLRAIQRNGGVALGAWVGGKPAGFVFGFVAHAPGVGFYHYSQVAAVDDAFQGRGIGRALKLAQREKVRAQGLTRMRWYFDPMRARNAHFNLDVLGADAVALERNLYGPGSGRDKGFATHRLVAEWALDVDPVRPHALAGGERISIPEDWDAYRSAHPQQARALSDGVADAFTSAFARGLRAAGVHRVGDGTIEYVLRERRGAEA